VKIFYFTRSNSSIFWRFFSPRSIWMSIKGIIFISYFFFK